MDFKDNILQFASRVDKICPQIKTEEATKNALIMPFIQLLGYDVFNPFEVSPEFVADIGIKKGEKVDYAIIKDDKPIILIECKHYTQDLNPHNSQLFRYFHTTEARFGLLTNSVTFKFYTDLVTPNKMDDKPFFEFKITEIKDNEIVELKKFTKDEFSIENISNTASDLKFLNAIKSHILNEITNPSEEFVKYYAKKVYPGLITQKLLDQFTIITKRAFNLLISESINDRLKTALKTESGITEPLTETAKTAAVNTTEAEKEAYMVIKSILRQVIKVERIVLRDAQSYCAILLDDNNRKPICRLYLDGKKKFLEIPTGNKQFEKKEITCIDDIYNLSDNLLNSEFVKGDK